MSTYKLIAFDMDGTLLNSRKEIDPETIKAIHEAKQAGKTIILSTGRGPSELTEYEEELVDVDYYCCISGALVYDTKKKVAVYSHPMKAEIVQQVFDIAEKEDIMIQFLNEESIVSKSDWEHMEDYGMGVYKQMFRRVCYMVDDVKDWFMNDPMDMEKMNLYHRSPKVRERTRKRMVEAGIPVEMVHAELGSLELTAKGVSKGKGLRKLCEHLGLSIEETIMVGDADNDIEGLKAAGLAIGMGNSKPSIAPYVDVYVADNDHGGCVEAIRKYLLA